MLSSVFALDRLPVRDRANSWDPGCLPGDLVPIVQLMEDVLVGKHVVMSLPTGSFDTRMQHASILKVRKAADDACFGKHCEGSPGMSETGVM